MELSEAPVMEEVKRGYMRTEVGSIPVDWRVVTLRDTCSFENGDRGVNYPSPTSFVESGIPFVNAGHLTDGRIESVHLDYITREAFERLGAGKFKQGDILFCLRGTLGKFGVVEGNHPEGAIASSLVIVRPRAGTLDAGFLRCYFGSRTCALMIDKWSGGAAQPNLGAQDLARFAVAIPPSREEQRAIATALSDVDTLLGSLDALIAKKKAIKQGAMQQLLTGKQRLPGFKGEWEKRTFGDVAGRIVGGGTPSRSREDYWGRDIPWVAVKDFACFDPRGTQEWITKSGLANSASNLIPKGSLIIATRIALGQALIYDVDVAINQDLKGVLPSEKMDARFMYYWFQQFGSVMVEKGAGSTVLGVLLSDLRSLELLIPTNLEEQTAIARVLSDMDAELAALEARRAKTALLKQGMMQELLTGRTRLV